MNNDSRKWMVGLLTTLMLGWAAWVSAGVIESKSVMGTLERMSKQLDRIEQRIDALAK